MKNYFFISSAAHGVFLAMVVFVGTFLSKPRMSYYAVDLLSGPPPGASSPVEAAPEPVKAPPVADQAPAKPELKTMIKEAIRIKEKEPKKPLPKPAPVPVAAKPVAISGALRSLSGFSNASPTTGAGNLGGSSLVAEASGPAFPFPWYLKAITDKLDAHWKPPQEFQDNTVCQVTFVIARDGAVSGAELRKSSGDSFFDQLAIRAVQNASPMPPLPSGFPEDRLRVHMKFIGKQ